METNNPMNEGSRTMEVLQNVEVTVLPEFLTIGKDVEGRVKSPIASMEQAKDLFEEARSRLVKVTDRKCAICIDGRCAVCTAADVVDDVIPEEPKEVEVLAKVPGGLFHHATMMAVGAGWSLIQGAKTFNEARAIVSNHLTGLGYRDGIHTSVVALFNPNGTECAAKDKAEPATRDGAESTEVAGTMATMWNAKSAEELESTNSNFSVVRENLRRATDPANGYFEGYNPAAERDEMMRENPGDVEVLESSKEHPTHKHVEEGIVINEVDGTTIDRDALAGRLFGYDRWMPRQLAHDMAGTPEEAERLLMASDYVTLNVADAIVAPGMPVAVLSEA